jgi:hypothetical protein
MTEARTDADGARVEFSSPLVDCGCPEVHGLIRHDREVCTDPVVIKLDWFPQ